MLPLRYPWAWLIGGLVVMAIILGLALAPMGRVTASLMFSDKFMHAMAFAALMVWFCGVFRLPFTPLVALGLLAFGGAIELFQGMLPYRAAEVGDLLADGVGIAAGWVLALLGLRYWTRWAEDMLSPRAGP